VTPFLDIDLALDDRRDGKVRISYAYPHGQRLFITTDRLSAFDRVIAGVPYKGQVLNQLSAWWFERTADVVPNHVVELPDPNVLIARSAQPLPVEVTPFALEVVQRRFHEMGLEPVLRMHDGSPRITDEGHRILDVMVPQGADIADVVVRIREHAGVVETGFFPHEATEAIIAGADGIRRMKRP